MRYANSVMTTYFDGHAGAQEEPCVVIFREGEMVIEYLREGRPSTYRGVQEGNQYRLLYWPEIKGFVGEAFLNLPEGNLLDGAWSEHQDGSKSVGTWEIELKE
jgi:hypothetical protein